MKYFQVIGENESLQEGTKKNKAFPAFENPMSENGLKVFRSKFAQKMISMQVVENFLGEVQSSQRFKRNVVFESEDIVENKRLKGKLRLIYQITTMLLQYRKHI